jgi:hypothetical protein
MRLFSKNQQAAVANGLGSFASVCRCRDLGISLGAMPMRFVLTFTQRGDRIREHTHSKLCLAGFWIFVVVKRSAHVT